MRAESSFVLALVLSVASATAVACSCAPVDAIEELEHAGDVVVARVVSSDQEPIAGNEGGRYIVEQASFEVIEVIKGSKAVADKIQIRSEIGPGLCGRSARNSPVWLEAMPSPPSDEPPKAVSISGTWLIYGYGSEPYELDLCSRSGPLEMVDRKELKVLRKRAKELEKEQ